MNVLVVGGAGYIGAHAARGLQQAGHLPILYDNLSLGHRACADRLKLPLVTGDLLDGNAIERTLVEYDIQAVMHFAAFAAVGESVVDPAKYYRNNVAGSLSLLEAMRRRAVLTIVFSSTCATYGDPLSPRLDESHPQQPVNPYGWSKLMVERMLDDYSAAYGLRYAALRYFNASGCSHDGLLGEDHDPETHLIPLCLKAAISGQNPLTIFGTDYDTPDGTCVRDYIHVEDLADAHVLALEHLRTRGTSLKLNVGTGQGHSVREVIQTAAEVAGRPVPHREGPRRPGDPPVLVADASRIGSELGWKPRYTKLKDIIATAWPWFEAGGKYPRDR